MNRKQPISIAFGISILLVLSAVGFFSFGYYLTSDYEELAQELVAKGKPVSHCKRMIFFDPFGPPLWEKKIDCHKEYARLTLNPSVCEELLPLEAGLRCLGNVWGKIVGPLPCLKTDGKSWVTCNDEESLGDITIDEPQIANCSLYQRRDLEDWCHTERTEKISNTYECDQIQLPSVKDHCEATYAFNQKDLTSCSKVLDQTHRQYCEIRINTWLQYPELRDSFYFGREVPVDGTGSIL